MSGVELKPVGKRGPNISLPVGKTTVGRGPFLGCTDKRISRNHAVLEVYSDGKLTLMPIHVNPCFKVSGDAEVKPLDKGVAFSLSHGDCFSMLPSAYQYEVVITGAKANSQDGSANTNILNNLKNRTSPAHLDEEEPHKVSTASVSKKDETQEEDAPTTISSTTKLNKNEVVEKKENAVLISDDGPSTSSASANRKRTLPTWLMDAAEQQGTVKQKTPPKRTPVSKPKANSRQAGDGDENEVKQANASKTVKGSRLTPSTKAKQAKSPNTPTKGKNSAKINNGRLNCDMSEDSDEDAPPIKKTQPKVTAASTKATTTGKKTNYEMSDEDSDAEPAANVAKTQKASPKKKRTPCTYGAKCYRKNPAHFKDFSHPADDDYDSDPGGGGDRSRSPDGDDSNDSRPECEFGLSCYRKNPQHRKDYKHTAQKPPPRAAAKKARAKVRRKNDDSDEDDDDSDDSFIDDDSDDYKPGSDEDSGDDPSLLLAEAEKFKRNKNLLKPV